MWKQFMVSAVRGAFRPLATYGSFNNVPFLNKVGGKVHNHIVNKSLSTLWQPTSQVKLLNNSALQNIATDILTRNVTKYSFRKGRRKAVKIVLRRFYRLAWGGWIRTRCGRHKKLWKKTSQNKRRLRQHVLCNATQSTLLDKMVGSYWRRPKYYVEDPYEPYHVRNEFPMTSNKPRPYFPPE